MSTNHACSLDTMVLRPFRNSEWWEIYHEIAKNVTMDILSNAPEWIIDISCTLLAASSCDLERFCFRLLIFCCNKVRKCFLKSHHGLNYVIQSSHVMSLGKFQRCDAPLTLLSFIKFLQTDASSKDKARYLSLWNSRRVMTLAGACEFIKPVLGIIFSVCPATSFDAVGLHMSLFEEATLSG